MGKRVSFTVNHAPFGKARVGWGGTGKRGGAFVDAKTKTALAAVRDGWLDTGAPGWPRGAALSIQVTCRLTRPGGHVRSDGISMSKAGIEAGLFVTKRPDVDNVAKTIMDALNTYAYHDDGQVVHLAIVKLWTNGPGRMDVTIEEVSNDKAYP